MSERKLVKGSKMTAKVLGGVGIALCFLNPVAVTGAASGVAGPRSTPSSPVPFVAPGTSCTVGDNEGRKEQKKQVEILQAPPLQVGGGGVLSCLFHTSTFQLSAPKKYVLC